MTALTARAGATLVMAGAVAGCGSSGEASGPTRAEYAARADGVCAEIIRSSESLARLRPQGVQDVVRVIDRLERTVDGGMRRLDALEHPAGAAGADAQGFVDAFEAELRQGVLPALADMRRAALASDVPGLRRAVRRLQAIDNSGSNALARRLGARRCAS